MEGPRTRNDLGAALVRFCIALEEHRRTPEGRVRTPAQFLEHFFPHATTPNDRVFSHMPKEVRGPILSSWGIRGAKAALRDDDAKVLGVVYDALLAGDLDAERFESALTAPVLLAWVPLGSFWSFWRAGAIGKPSLMRAFSIAYETRLLDGRVFFDTLRSKNGELKGTDVLGAALSKDELIEWVRKVHASGDGSPKGLIEAIGWEKIVQKTPTESLLGVLDALAQRLGLAAAEQAVMSERTIVAPAAPDGHTPAGADVAIESVAPKDGEEVTSTSENPTTDPPPADDELLPFGDGSEEVPIETAMPEAPSSDLAKTGPYATPPKREKESAPRIPRANDEHEDADETKLYRPARRGG